MCTKIFAKTFGRFKNFDYFCAVIQHISHTASQPRSLAASQPRSLAASQPRSLAASQPRSLAASQQIHLYILGAIKLLLISMPYIKPATATHASAGIRRMEAELPLCAMDAGVQGQRGRAVADGHGLCQRGASAW